MPALRSLGALAFALLIGTSACTKLATTTNNGRHPWTIPGVLRIGESEEPDALNPLFSNTSAADRIETLLFAYVFRYDAHGNLLPEIATVLPTYANGGIARDNRTITLRLRHGVRWSDGAPLDGRDLRFTWRAVMNPRNNTKTRNGWDDVAAIDVPDPYTVVVHLKKPNSAILAGLFGGGGGSSYPPLPEHLLGRLPDLNHADFNRRPISSGPWLLKTWAHGASLTFTPNATYWRGAPKLHELQWKIVPNDETLLTQLQTHDIDVYDPVPENQLAQLAAIPGITTATRLVANWRHLDMNVRNPILRDVRVRRAIAQAVDWDRMNATIYHGVHERATSDIVPDSWAAPHIPLWHFDPEAAQQLLAAAGWMPAPDGIRRKNGAPLELVISSGTNRPASAAAEVQIQQQLRAVGIDLRIKNYPVSYLFAPNGPLYGGTYDLSWSVDTNGPEPDNSGYWSARFIPPHGANTSFIDDPVLTQTSEAALATFDHAKRKALYQREEERIHELAPTVVLYWERSTVAYNSDLRNYVPAEYDMAAMWNSYAWEI